MNIIDVVIILFILLIGIIGWHNGFIKTIVSAVGIILVFSLSFILKNPILFELDFWALFHKLFFF